MHDVNIPEGSAFIEAAKKKGHFFLAATEGMSVVELVRKLTWIADKMSKIENAGCAL